MSKKSEKIYQSKLAFKQIIAVYIVQNGAMAVLLELFKRGNFVWDTRYANTVLSQIGR